MGFDPVPLEMSFAHRERLYPKQAYNCRAPKRPSYHYQESGSSPIHSVKNPLQLVKATKQCVPRAFEAVINWLSCSMDNGGNILHKTMCEIIIDQESMCEQRWWCAQRPENFSTKSHDSCSDEWLGGNKRKKAKGSIIGLSYSDDDIYIIISARLSH